MSCDIRNQGLFRRDSIGPNCSVFTSEAEEDSPSDSATKAKIDKSEVPRQRKKLTTPEKMGNAPARREDAGGHSQSQAPVARRHPRFSPGHVPWDAKEMRLFYVEQREKLYKRPIRRGNFFVFFLSFVPQFTQITYIHTQWLLKTPS